MTFENMNKFLISDNQLQTNQLPSINIQHCTNKFIMDLHAKSKLLKPNSSLTSFYEWILLIFGLERKAITLNMVTSKTSKLKNKLKSLRGERKEEFLNSLFEFSSTEPKTRAPTLKRNIAEVYPQKALAERRTKVKELNEQNKQLKRKLDRSNTKLEENKKIKLEIKQKQTEEINSTKRENCNLKSELKRKTKYHQMAVGKNIELTKEMKELRIMNKVYKEKHEINDAVAGQYLENLNSLEKEVCMKESKVEKLEIENDYLRSLLVDDSTVETYDEDNNCFNTQLVECVMNLSNCNVAANKMSKVIEQVCKLCKKTPTKLPSEWTVNRINISKSNLALAQIETLTKQEDLTLYTDETSKFGRSFEVYAVTDKDQNSYLLGLREMVNKSSQTVLDTFKDIVNDINDINPSTETGHQILGHIKNTMSDRAATEKKFHELLSSYREDVLPKITNSWTELDEKEKDACSTMNNFFCGLHLLVGCADVSAKAISDFESAMTETTLAPVSIWKGKKGESGTVRLIRCCSKAFARGADEKSGVHGQWKTYIEGKSLKVLFLPFKHNRFNIIFLLGGIVYFHHENIIHFLENIHGVTNGLLEQIATDIKSDVFLAGCRAFGLISKLITAPLWRLIEGKLHILRMNAQYLQLCKYLEELTVDTCVTHDFIAGRSSPFDILFDADDIILKKLIEPCHLDDQTCQIVMLLSKAVLTLLQRQLKDQLPGGKYEEFNKELLDEAQSVMKHNKLPEFFFGQLDFLLKYRPNASLLCNEAFLMFAHNKTDKWLAEMDEDAKTKLLQECRKNGKEINTLFKTRLHSIKQKRQQYLKEKEEQIKLKRQKTIKSKEDATTQMIYYGLWQSHTEVDKKLSEINILTEKKKAVQSQLKFRKKVLLQKSPTPGIYNFSCKSKQLTLSQLTDNLKKLIEEAFSRLEQDEPRKTGTPLLVNKRVGHKFSDGDVYNGKVLSVVPGYPSWYNIKYDDFDDIYVYDLLQDYGEGNLTILVN